MINPRDNLGRTSPESITSIPSSNPSSAGTTWASSVSPDYFPAQHAYPGQNPLFPPSAAKPNVQPPYVTTEAASSFPGNNRMPIPRLRAPPTHHDNKRIRDKKQFAFLKQRVDQYETLLRGLEGEADAPTARRIRRALKVKGTKPSAEKPADGSDSESSVGSLEDVDLVDEDVNRNESTRAAGFFGKNSEVSWMQRLESDVEKSSSREQTAAGSPIVPIQRESQAGAAPIYKLAGDVPLAEMNYHLDDLPIPLIENVNPLGLPRRELADRYFNAYMTFIHPTFSAIRKPMFTAQYRKFFSQAVIQPHRKWLAIFNMVLAIGCRYCRLLNPDNTAHEEDLVFLTRARHLSLHEGILFEHTDLQQAQLEFLVAVYLLCLGQVNRASKFSSMALRSALSLGINLRLVDDRIDKASKEARSRLWWSIYSIESLLTSMNGRASSVGESICSVSLPVPAEEESFDHPEVNYLFEDTTVRDIRLCPTIFETSSQIQDGPVWTSEYQPCPSFFFYCLVDLALMTQAILNKVYSIEAIRQGTSQTEYQLQKYGLRLDRWLHRLPVSYRFTVSDAGPWHLDHARVDESAPFIRERVSLALNYYSARITLCRPCLTQTHSSRSGTKPTAPHELSSRGKIRARIATDCLQAACSLLSVLPESADVPWLARIAPYWSILHFLMQGTTALLLGMSYCSFGPGTRTTPPLHQPQSPTAPGTPEATDPSSVQYPPLLETDLHTIVVQTKKAFVWIHAMASIDPAARRAFDMCDKVMRRIAPDLQIDLQDWPSKETLRGGWNEGDTAMEELEELVDFEGSGFF